MITLGGLPKGLVINTEKSMLETEFATSWAWIENNKLRHELLQKQTTLKIRLQVAEKTISQLRERIQVLTRVMGIPEKRSGFINFLVWTGGIFWGLFVLASIVLILLKFVFKRL
jgi:hypothetical protein